MKSKNSANSVSARFFKFLITSSVDGTSVIPKTFIRCLIVLLDIGSLTSGLQVHTQCLYLAIQDPDNLVRLTVSLLSLTA